MDAMTMTFGVEIECLVPEVAVNNGTIVIGSYGTPAAVAQAPGWKSKTDASLRANPGYRAVEFVSPILSGETGLASLKNMTDLLRQVGARVNRSCGLHVHVGCPAEVPLVKNLTINVGRFETALFAASGTRARMQASWCKSIKGASWESAPYRRLANAADNATAASELRNCSDRYHVLNLTHISRNLGSTTKTVEFRVFAGTTNYTKISAYVMLCLGIVQKSAKRNAKPEQFDGPITTNPSAMRQGEGATAMQTLLTWLNWVHVRGPVQFGSLMADKSAQIAELRRLAKKFDGESA